MDRRMLLRSDAAGDISSGGGGAEGGRGGGGFGGDGGGGGALGSGGSGGGGQASKQLPAQLQCGRTVAISLQL